MVGIFHVWKKLWYQSTVLSSSAHFDYGVINIIYQHHFDFQIHEIKLNLGNLDILDVRCRDKD